ncbi:hypothetical protein ACSQ67_009219 [Phaseolus vulgaris]
MANMVFVGVKVAAVPLAPLPITGKNLTSSFTHKKHLLLLNCSQTNNRTTSFSSSFSSSPLTSRGGCCVLGCLPPASSESSTPSSSTAKPSSPFPSIKLYEERDSAMDLICGRITADLILSIIQYVLFKMFCYAEEFHVMVEEGHLDVPHILPVIDLDSIVICHILLKSTDWLSFRTTEESLRNAFKNFGQLVEVKLVMDRIANRPRGFAFLRYATEEESQKAIEGMHGKFLDGRVIFVEIAKPRSELPQRHREGTRL